MGDGFVIAPMALQGVVRNTAVSARQSQRPALAMTATDASPKDRLKTDDDFADSKLKMSGMEKYMPELKANAKKMVMPGKGLLACDESTGTVGARLESIGMVNNEENRMKWRNLLFTTPSLETTYLEQFCLRRPSFRKTLMELLSLTFSTKTASSQASKSTRASCLFMAVRMARNTAPALTVCTSGPCHITRRVRVSASGALPSKSTKLRACPRLSL